MAELIRKTDTLNQGREKLNAAITDAEKAKVDAGAAVSTSNQARQIAQTAENKADSVQAQFDQVIIEGDSSVEAAAARVGTDNVTYPTLKARLDAEHTQVTAQLADIDNELGIKEQQINSKMDKNTTNISVTQINKNLGKFDQTYMTEEFLSQMAGNTPINSVPADNSLTTPKYVNGSVSRRKLSEELSGINNFSIKPVFENGKLTSVGEYDGDSLKKRTTLFRDGAGKVNRVRLEADGKIVDTHIIYSDGKIESLQNEIKQ